MQLEAPVPLKVFAGHAAQELPKVPAGHIVHTISEVAVHAATKAVLQLEH